MVLTNIHSFLTEGVNAILPNLDLVFVASTMCEMERLPITYHLNVRM